MKRFTYYGISLMMCMGMSVSSAQAEDWVCNFDNEAAKIGSNHSIREVVINNLRWKTHAFRGSSAGYDWMNGSGSGRIYGEKMSMKAPPYMEMAEDKPGGIGTVSFAYHAYPTHEGTQVEWIVQVSDNGGENWNTIGDPFLPDGEMKTFTATANLGTGRMRIVRADYLTFDHTKAGSFSAAFNIDDMVITDSKQVAPDQPNIYPEKEMIVFEGVEKGGTLEQVCKVNFKNLTDPISLTFSEPTTTFSLSTNVLQINDQGTAEFTIGFSPKSVGQHSATLLLTSGAVTARVALQGTAVRKPGEYSFSGGQGTEADPYLITLPADFIEMSQAVNDDLATFEGKFFKMTQDIDMKSVDNLLPIGNNHGSAAVNRPFKGVFDGDNHTISNLNINLSGINNLGVGLFGLTVNAVIKNVTITNSSFGADAIVGSVVGVANGGEILNCHAGENVKVSAKSQFYAGGILSASMEGPVRIADCSSMADVIANSLTAGGIVSIAAAEGTSVERCINYGSVWANNDLAGGIVGYAEKGVHIVDCANVGSVMAPSGNFGGIAGGVMPNYPVRLGIWNCYDCSSSVSAITPDPMNPDHDIIVRNSYYADDDNNLSATPVFGVKMASADMTGDGFVDQLNAGREQLVWHKERNVNDGRPVPMNLNGLNTGIESAQTQNAPAVAVVNGHLLVPEGYVAACVHDMQGRSFKATSVLPQGVYVVVLVKNGEPLKPVSVKVLSR